MAVNQGPLSGFRDMLAPQAIPRQQMLDVIKVVYENYGFTPLKTPALERYSTLSGKYGEEGDKLMYRFEDQGGREVALRYDLTVPLARVVAQYGSQIPLPYKRYAVGEVWRGERAQAGRFREFTQFDADTIGSKSPLADAEIVAVMSDSMAALGARSVIRVNNRRILDALAGKAGITDEKAVRAFMSSIDKVEKIGLGKALAEILKNFSQKATTLASGYLEVQGSSNDKLQSLVRLMGDSEAIAEGVENLSEVFKILAAAGYSEEQVVFDQAIARGLDYYTGIIYETTLVGAESLGSVCGGGRYDNLVKALGGPDLPAVGTSIGVDRLFDGLQLLGKLQNNKTSTQVLIANFDSADSGEYLRIAAKLRAAGIAAEIYYDPAKLGKQISFADKMSIPYVVLLGSEERAKSIATIRSLDTGNQEEVPIAKLSEALRKLVK
ncbi:MAG TPA: histidine--tRNA ligase [Candidatus Nitrosopolaris sp.]|nr:histidine--tRNA ligase [Candidatus Nitrosopolaris sp.]